MGGERERKKKSLAAEKPARGLLLKFRRKPECKKKKKKTERNKKLQEN